MPDGEVGELVFTTLTKEALPLLRYRTGDLASLTREPCVLRPHASPGCRASSAAPTKHARSSAASNVFPSEIERALLAIPGAHAALPAGRRAPRASRRADGSGGGASIPLGCASTSTAHSGSLPRSRSSPPGRSRGARAGAARPHRRGRSAGSSRSTTDERAARRERERRQRLAAAVAGRAPRARSSYGRLVGVGVGGYAADSSPCQRLNAFPSESLQPANQPWPGTGILSPASPPSSRTFASDASMSGVSK